MGNEQVNNQETEQKQQNTDKNIPSDECFWNEHQALLSHNLLMKKWENELKLDINWKHKTKFKDTSKLYTNSILSQIKMDNYGTKHLNSIWYKHPNFTLKRREIQHDIIDLFVETPKTNNNNKPWVISLGGASCIGKSYMLSQLLKYNLIPQIQKEVCVIGNHDLIRPCIPEWELYLNDNDKTPMYDLLYTELVYLFQCIMWRGLEKGKNVLIDGTMKNYFTYKRFIDIIKTNYSNYKIGFIFIEPKEFNIDKIKERLKKRIETTGRQTPIKIIEDSYEKSKVNYNRLKQEFDVDAAIRIVNIGEGNKIEESPIIFDHIGLECKLKHLIKWSVNGTGGNNKSLLDIENVESFKIQIESNVKENP